jgi:hypothetical protein
VSSLPQPLEIGEAKAPWRPLILHCLVAVLFLVPLAYAGMLLSVAAHEVLGHGLAAVCLGGKFLGFHMTLTGHGWSSVPLPPDAPAWKEITLLSAGMGAEFLLGAGLLILAVKVVRGLAGMGLLVVAFDFLLGASAYMFWNACCPVPPGDTGRLVEMAGVRWLAPVLAVGSGIVLFGGIWLLTALLLRQLEGWLVPGGWLVGSRRIFVLLVLGLLPAPFWMLVDWNRFAPGIGVWPNVVGALAHLVSACSLYWVRFRPLPLSHSPSRRAVGAAIGAGWACAALGVAATLLWFSPGSLGEYDFPGMVPEGPILLITHVAPSPDATRLAFIAVRGHGGSHPELPARLHVLDIATGEVRDVDGEDRLVGAGFAWRPDGSAIAFPSAHADNAWGLDQVTLADGNVTVLVRGQPGVGPLFHPRFSPDGRWLGAVQGRRVVVRDLASGAERQVAQQLGEFGLDWCWARDSSAVFFVGDGGIYRRRLSEEKEELLCRPAEANLDEVFDLRVSPDGQSLAFLAGDGLRVVNLRTGGERPLLSGHREVRDFDWGPAGICFTESPGTQAAGPARLMLLEPSAAEPRLIAEGRFTRPVAAGDRHVAVVRGLSSLWLYDVRTCEGRELFTLESRPAAKSQAATSRGARNDDP